ncbi:MAG: MarR family transcriptional regulator [Rhodobacteraceae bacterium]|nr:MarR family transcriptional regulator [Paracoccaceae bacterium]
MRDTLSSAITDFAAGMGLSRPAGLCFAAIWSSPAPVTADELTARLGIARSNASTALRELRDWGLVAVERRPGDRKEYFVAPDDPWEIARRLLAGRQRRILAPLLERLLEAEAETGNPRVAALHAAAERADGWLYALAALDGAGLRAAMAAPPSREGGGKNKKKKRKG